MLGRKELGPRYLELVRELAKDGNVMSDARADAIFVEMRTILSALDPDARKSLVELAEIERRRIVSRARSGVPHEPDQGHLAHFRFLCRIPRAQATNLALEKLGPGWLSYLKSLGIWVPYRELVVINDPDDSGAYLAFHVEAGRLF